MFSMTSPIPLPPADNPQFKDVMDYFETLQNRKMKQPLIEAQTQEAQANAQKSKMLANLINIAFGGSGMGSTGGGAPGQPGSMPTEFGAVNQASPEEVARIAQNGNGSGGAGGYNPTPTEMSRIGQMKPGESVVLGQESVGQAQGQPQAQFGAAPPVSSAQQKARDMLYSLGVLKESPADQEAREKRTAYQRELGSSDVKTLEKWNDILTSNSQITPVLENIQEISANPAFQAMYKNPEYFGYDLAYLKRFGTPEQQQLLTTLGTNAKSIFQAMGQEFKGAFREFELNLFNKAAPDEIKDTAQQIISKTNTMLSLRNLISKRMSLANNIVRSSAGQISPANALEIADKQINAKAIREDIQNKFNQSQEEQKAAQKNRAKESGGLGSTVTVVDPSGGEHVVARNKLDAALKKYPELKVKEANS